MIFSAFVFSMGYEKTGLGKRLSLTLMSHLGGRSLTLGYAVMVADLLLAPFTPSNTARSGGTIFPIIKNILLSTNRFPTTLRRGALVGI